MEKSYIKIIDRMHQNCMLTKACSVVVIALLFFHNTISGYSNYGNLLGILLLVMLWLMNAKYLSIERYIINSHGTQVVSNKMHRIGLVPCAASWSVSWFHFPIFLMSVGITELWIWV